ncbi:MAG: sugar transferase [Tenericutes bacterium HGW-Tenericutes-2]|jgi:lipopolysaccharide/colanic/teichoic acid biosynthesis glycosyltransferase|nr:MAG: sugar transferase [Tenericutes bacterium HGW-Tenericutes-2]
MYVNIIKPLFDFVFTLLILPFLIIILIIFGILIKLEDGGSIFYTSLRLGKNGKPFKMYKLRSMKVNSVDLRNLDGTTYSSVNDDRLTKIGKFIRTTSIDELPQFINVLFFKMSVLGPRPDPIEWYEKLDVKTREKYSIKPGISGYTQAYFRNTLPLEKKNQYELFYAKNINILMDIKIFFRTIYRVLKKESVYRND